VPRTYQRTAEYTPVKCEVCDTEYLASPSRLARGTKRCSIECQSESRKKWKQCRFCLEDRARGPDTYCGRLCFNRDRALKRLLLEGEITMLSTQELEGLEIVKERMRSLGYPIDDVDNEIIARAVVRLAEAIMENETRDGNPATVSS
jgi:hypothetical protein